MNQISSYEKLDDLGRIRLSQHFFMRDFLHSEIAAWHGLRNVPEHPERAVEVGRRLCEQLLEPLQATFGRIHIRSGYRSPQVNKFGNENKLNCASNEANYAHHIWDYPDAQGKRGATACIVIPWLVDYMEKGGSWTAMAWWIHDHLPYGSLYFFSKLGAFNVNWHESPERRIDSYAPPKGCLTRPGMTNHEGVHADQYPGFPSLAKRVSSVGGKVSPATNMAPVSPDTTQGGTPGTSRAKPEREMPVVARPLSPAPKSPEKPALFAPPMTFKSQTGGAISYRAIHTKNMWRKVGNHTSLDKAILGNDGAVGLFARKVRISYETHGDPLYVLVWEAGAQNGYAVKPDFAASNGIRVTTIPMGELLRFEAAGQASQRDIEKFFAA